MERGLVQLSDDELRQQLLERYTRTQRAYPESDSIQIIKSELYRRGYQREDIVTIALASLLRRQRRAG